MGEILVAKQLLHDFGHEKSPKLVRASLAPALHRQFAEQFIAAKAEEAAYLLKDFLGNQITPALPMPGNSDVWYADYQNATIYWVVGGKGAFILGREIRDKWYALGGPSGFLGMPLIAYKNSPASLSEVEFEGGSICYSPATGAHELHGDIRNKWVALGGRTGLGFPFTDEMTTPDGLGRYNHFEHGSIYWTSDLGAQEVHGAIRDHWSSLGWEKSYLGYPVSDELATPEGAVSYFENGRINWIAATGEVVDTPDRIVRSCKLGPSTTTGEATLVLMANGYWAFKGRAWESGLIGHNFLITIYSRVLDASGHAIGARHNGELPGAGGVDNAKKWDKAGWDQRILDNWSALKESQFEAQMRVSSLGEEVLAMVVIGLALVPVAILLSGPVSCDPEVYRDDVGGAGVQGRCYRTPE